MNGWNIMMNRTWAHMFNMFVMKKEYYHEFCQWWFDVMFEVDWRAEDIPRAPSKRNQWHTSYSSWFVSRAARFFLIALRAKITNRTIPV